MAFEATLSFFIQLSNKVLTVLTRIQEYLARAIAIRASLLAYEAVDLLAVIG